MATLAPAARAFVAALPDRATDDDAARAMSTPDVWTGLQSYIVNYDGGFSFLRDMRAAATRYGFARFGVARTRGVLNCLRADLAREAAAPVVETGPAPVAVPDGTYTAVRADGTHLTIRVKRHWVKAEADAGVSVLSMDGVKVGFTRGTTLAPWARATREFPATVARAVEAWAVVIGDPLAAGEAYALHSGSCFRCNRELTVPASIHRGLGPECVKKWHGAMPGGWKVVKPTA